MRKDSNGKWIIVIITVLCVGMIGFFSNRKQDDQGNHKVNQITTNLKNGGRLLPGSGDHGKGTSSGKTSERKPASGTSASKKSTSATTEFDPDDHDIDSYYEDHKDEFDDYDDAYDAFEDDPDAWDDY